MIVTRRGPMNGWSQGLRYKHCGVSSFPTAQNIFNMSRAAEEPTDAVPFRAGALGQFGRWALVPAEMHRMSRAPRLATHSTSLAVDPILEHGYSPLKYCLRLLGFQNGTLCRPFPDSTFSSLTGELMMSDPAIAVQSFWLDFC